MRPGRGPATVILREPFRGRTEGPKTVPYLGHRNRQQPFQILHADVQNDTPGAVSLVGARGHAPGGGVPHSCHPERALPKATEGPKTVSRLNNRNGPQRSWTLRRGASLCTPGGGVPHSCHPERALPRATKGPKTVLSSTTTIANGGPRFFTKTFR